MTSARSMHVENRVRERLMCRRKDVETSYDREKASLLILGINLGGTRRPRSYFLLTALNKGAYNVSNRNLPLLFDSMMKGHYDSSGSYPNKIAANSRQKPPT
jgi:hypothetical protein